jgi:hypothetical protein
MAAAPKVNSRAQFSGPRPASVKPAAFALLYETMWLRRKTKTAMTAAAMMRKLKEPVRKAQMTNIPANPSVPSISGSLCSNSDKTSRDLCSGVCNADDKR